MNVDEYRAMIANQMSEDDLQAGIEELARRLGWLAYHTRDSRRSAAGFPDLVLVRGGRLIFAELKSMRGKASPDQREWLAALRNVAAEGVFSDGGRALPEVYVWRPDDWLADRILETLT